jgi:hypothetical protein
MPFILTYQGNWADEIDLEGFMLIKDNSYEQYKAFVDTYPEILNEKLHMHVGTNEDTYYCLSDIGVKQISEDDMNAIINALGIRLYSGSAEYGPFPYIFDDINNWCDGKGIKYPDWN